MKIFNFKKLNIFKKLNFKSSVTLFVSGYNLERYLNSLCNKKVEFLTIQKRGNKEVEIEVSPVYEKEVDKFLSGKNIEITKKKYNGFYKIQKFLFSRFGILIGLLISFCFFVIASNYVWNFQVIGNETHSSQEIILVLNNNGINFFDALNSNTNEEVERLILENFSEVSMVSVIKKGTTVVINIKEKILNEEHENVGENSALVATSDGIITSVELIQGTALVKVGDIVRAGQELIAPYVIDSSGTQIPIEPKAIIFADVWLSGESFHYDIKNIKERTGNVLIEKKTTFLGREIYANSIEVPFENYETEVEEVYLSDSILPVKYKTIKYFEIISKTVEQSFGEVEEEKILEAKNLAKIRMKDGENIKSENYVVTSLLGKTTVSYSITVNRKIS